MTIHKCPPKKKKKLLVDFKAAVSRTSSTNSYFNEKFPISRSESYDNEKKAVSRVSSVTSAVPTHFSGEKMAVVRTNSNNLNDLLNEATNNNNNNNVEAEKNGDKTPISRSASSNVTEILDEVLHDNHNVTNRVGSGPPTRYGE